MKDGLSSFCKKCDKDRHKNDYKKDKQKYKDKAKNYVQSNKEKVSQYQKQYRLDNAERLKQYDKERNQNANRRQYNAEYSLDFYYKSPKHKLSRTFATYMRRSLKGKKNGKHWEDIVDYDIQTLMIYIQTKFVEGMSWDNYGEWEIDHIRPISSFNFNSFEHPEFKQCWSLDNLQPLWKADNRSKKDKFEES